jgi:hypothetical protein
VEFGVILLTVSMYILAIYLWWRDHAPNYLVALIAGHVGSLLSPLWQALYGFEYNPQFSVYYRFHFEERFAALARLNELPLPRPVFLGAWTIALLPLAIFYLSRHRWWFPGYLTSLLTFVLFVLYHLLVELIGLRQGWWRYTGQLWLPLGMPETLLSALMNGLVSLGLLATLLLTRRYALPSLMLILLPMQLALCLFVNGVLGAPIYMVRLLQAQSWAGAIGLLGTLGLVVWGAHIVASSLGRPRDWRQVA